jgi:hypothetical protein
MILSSGFSYKLFISQKVGYDLNCKEYININSLLLTIGSLLRNFNVNWGKISSINYDIEKFNFTTVFYFFQGNLFTILIYSYVNLSDFMNKESYFKLERRELLYLLFFLIILLFDNYSILKKLKKIKKIKSSWIFMFDSKIIPCKNLIEVLEIKYNRMNSHFFILLIHLIFRFMYFLLKVTKFKTKSNYLENIGIIEYFCFFLLLEMIYFPKKVNKIYFTDLNYIENIQLKQYKCLKLTMNSNQEKIVFNEKELLKNKQKLETEKTPIIIINPICNKYNNSNQYLSNMKVGYIN